MARGRESKGAESQIADAKARSRRRGARNPEERDIMRKVEGLELSRRRVLRELATAQTEVQRTALEHALAHLDKELKKLQQSS